MFTIFLLSVFSGVVATTLIRPTKLGCYYILGNLGNILRKLRFIKFVEL